MDVAIRDWTFTHFWVRPVTHTWFKLYHKSISFSGTENVDWEKPIIFAPSHQNAFSDALCLILPTKYTEKRFIYPLIRADAFGNSKAVDWILTAFHMMPVYRPRDKVDLKQQNERVFERCRHVLAQKRNLLIHPEGNCIPKKRVRPFKKGLARIAFSAEEAHDFNLGVTVIPVGINYRNITEARKGVHIRFGSPIAVADFKEAYCTHPAAGITQLTRAVQEGVEDLTVNIQSDAFYSLAEELFEINRSSDRDLSGKAGYSKEELVCNQEIAQALQKAESQSHCDDLSEAKQKVAALKELLHRHKLSASLTLDDSPSFLRLLPEGLLYLALLPLIAYGWINNVIPWLLSHKLADSVKELQFKSSLRMLGGLLLFPLSYLIQATVVLLLTGSWVWALAYLISVPLAGILTLNIRETYRRWRQKVRLSLLSDSLRQTIRNLRTEILLPFRQKDSL